MDWKTTVLRGKDIKETLKELETQIDILQEDKEDCRKAYLKIKDEKFENEEIKRLKEELDFYKRNSLVVLSDEQRERAKEFQHEHYKKCETGHRSFVYTVTPTNVITIVELRCPKCGEIIDVSNYNE
jgi:hypothetical protein|nr:MAG TPA_asm: ubiquitin-binding zinc finger protein [Caudoviricetes sp.]